MFKCPVNYELDNCSSKEYGLTCDTCFHVNENTHVYCTDCLHFRLCDEGLPYCYYENKCNINNYKDSKPFTERPKYQRKEK
jgi:hypothetical protein